MKKFLITVWIVVLLLLASNFAIIQYSKMQNTAQKPATETVADEKQTDDKKEEEIITFTVTAVGDCTFATDIYDAGKNCFKNILKKNDKDYSYFFKNVIDYFEDDDLTLINLEGALSDRGKRAAKQYAFRGNSEYVQIMTDSSVEAANLANNHTKDYGKDALKDTKDVLFDNGITSFGLEDISVMDIKGIKVGLIGTNALNYESRTNYPEIFEELLNEKPDIIIASFHWGAEKASSPNQIQKDLAHKAIDNGADLVIGHHPHVIQGIEKYKGKYIVYSLGNFCFGGNSSPSDKDTMIFRQTFNFKNGEITNDEAFIIPCSISSVKSFNNYQPTPLSGDEFDRVKEKIIKRSSYFDGIDDIEFIKGNATES